jgi:uridine kinase
MTALPPEPPRFAPPPQSLALAEALADIIATRIPLSSAEGLVIGIAGESGSGKSLTAASLVRALDDRGCTTAVIHQDDYFKLPPRTNHEQRLTNLAHVGPHEVDLVLIRAHIAAFRAGTDVTDAPLVDYPGNRFISHVLHFVGRQALIVEGTYALTLDELDVRVFLEATHEETRQRRRERNRDIDAPIIDQILTIEHEIVAHQAQGADIIIDRQFAIHVPSRRSQA